MTFKFGVSAITLGLAAMVLAGCSGKPARVVGVGYSGSAGADCVKKYDKNGDGGLDDTELKSVDGLARAKSRFDANSDGKITADEIDARIAKWVESKIGLTQFSVGFTYGNKPLDGATIKLVPEDWLGTEVKPGTGTTDATGRANIVMAQEDLRADEKGLPGMRLGVYRVEVTHPSIQLPAKFNTQSEIGVEVANDDPEMGRLMIDLVP